MEYLDDYSQIQFEIIELIIPYNTVCTPIANVNEAWHTPTLCEEESDAVYSLFFCKNNAPIIVPPHQAIEGKSVLNSLINRNVTSLSLSTTKLKAGEGLASRGTMSFSCQDKKGDPGPVLFTDEGTFFGKLLARNILDGKKVITHYYAVGRSGLAQKVNQTTHFVTSATLSDGVFTCTAKDALKDLEAFSQQFPIAGEVTLTSDIDVTTTTIPVSDSSSFAINDRFKIDKEIFWIESVSEGSLTVKPRGTGLTNGERIIYKTKFDEHSKDATLQPCYLMNETPLADVLADVFDAVGLIDFADYDQWNNEITQWDGDAKLYGLMCEPDDASNVIDGLLGAFLVDMWLEQSIQKAQVATNTAWKTPRYTFEEGNDVQNYKVSTSDNTRFSRARILVGKEYQAENDDKNNYSRNIGSSNIESEHPDFYGSVKLKEFDPNPIISGDSALRLTARYTQRYSETPRKVTLDIEERKVKDLKVGQVIDIISRDKQSPSGSSLTQNDRIQILQLQPTFDVGRKHKLTGLAYIPLFAANTDEEQYVTLTGSIRSINLATYVAAPTNTPLNYTFIFDGCDIGSAEEAGSWLPAIRAGAWHPDSRVRIICINDCKWSAKGGDFSKLMSTSAGDGGVSFKNDDITCELYINYTVESYIANSFLFSAGGGGGSSFNFEGIIFAAGGGGSGLPGGVGGTGFSGTSNDGSFYTGGYGSDAGVFNPGDGGDAGNNGQNSTSTNQDPINTNGGLAGFAIDGTADKVTVYNTEPDKFKAGRSIEGVHYTLVEA